MDAIHSWIDEEEVARLAKTLSTSPERMKEWKKLESDGFAIPEKQGESLNDPLENEEERSIELTEESLVKQRSLLAGASQMAKSAGLMHSEKKPAILENIKTQETEDVLEQIEAAKVEIPPVREASADKKGTFVMVQEMFSRKLNDAGLCIIDRDGDILYDSFENLSLSHFTSTVMKNSNLMQVNDGEIGNTRIRHSATEVIEFLSVKSTRGVVLVASRLSQGLSVDQREQTSQELLQILNTN